MILIYSFLDSLQTNHIYVVYNMEVIYVISELFNLNEFLNLTIIELSSDEFKSKYMKMISETESIYDKSEKLIKNLK